jgi:hypothetical protein
MANNTSDKIAAIKAAAEILSVQPRRVDPEEVAQVAKAVVKSVNNNSAK